MSTCKVNGVELYYDLQGEGEAIVFTHGASWDHKQWELQMKYFSVNYRVVTWDVRGHGQSSLPEGKVDAEDFTRDLIGLLDHLAIEKAHLCGLSMGGHISLQTAIHYPERVHSLILIGTPFTNSFNWYEKLFVPINRWSSRVISMKTTATMQANMLSKNNPHNKVYIEQVVQQIPRRNWIRLWDAITRMESKEQLGDINCPTLLLQGEQDTMIGRQQQYMNEKITSSAMKIVKNAHHATNLDNPTEVNRYILEFLRSR